MFAPHCVATTCMRLAFRAGRVRGERAASKNLAGRVSNVPSKLEQLPGASGAAALDCFRVRPHRAQLPMVAERVGAPVGGMPRALGAFWYGLVHP